MLQANLDFFQRGHAFRDQKCDRLLLQPECLYEDDVCMNDANKHQDTQVDASMHNAQMPMQPQPGLYCLSKILPIYC